MIKMVKWIKDKILYIGAVLTAILYFLWRKESGAAHKAQVREAGAEAKLEAEKKKSELKTLKSEISDAETIRKNLVDSFRSGRSDDS